MSTVNTQTKNTMSTSKPVLTGIYEISLNNTSFEIKINLPKQRINLRNTETGDEISLGSKAVKSDDIKLVFKETIHSKEFWEVKAWGLLLCVDKMLRGTTFTIYLLGDSEQNSHTEVIGFRLPNLNF